MIRLTHVFRPLIAFSAFLLLQTSPLLSAVTTKKTIEMMSYNVENLFDTAHDDGKDDWTFLPINYPGKKEACAKVSSRFYRSECYKTDWTEEKLQLKLSQIKKLILSERKKLPDVLALIEVENENVVKKLAHTLGYKEFFVTASPDERGIDVALLYNPQVNLKMISHKEYNLHELNILDNRTRNILEVIFDLGNKETLSVFVNHWPSQGNPTEDRLAIADFLHDQIEEELKIPGRHVIAMGDFNTLVNETPNPTRDHLSASTSNGAPMLDDVCDDYLKLPTTPQTPVIPRGTHYFAKEHNWNYLDKFLVSSALVSSSLKNKTKVLIDSFRIYAPDFAQMPEGVKKASKSVTPSLAGKTAMIPKRYDFHTLDPEKAGFSDHLPITLLLSI
jgi:endonuclease/exonuclease/phosphatase family metal-dependent hydrolase